MAGIIIYLAVSGCCGFGLWIVEAFLPWLKRKKAEQILKKRFNFVLFSLAALIVLIYFLIKLISLSLFLFIASHIAIGFGSIYLITRLVSIITQASGLNFDLTILIISIITFFTLLFFSLKDHMLLDLFAQHSSKSQEFEIPADHNVGKLYKIGKYLEGDLFEVRFIDQYPRDLIIGVER